MKKLFVLLLAMALGLGLAACNGGNTEEMTTTQAATEAPTEAETREAAWNDEWKPAPVDPEFDAGALFAKLEGYWNSPHGDPELVGVYGFRNFRYEDGKPSLYTGVYDGEGGPIAALAGGASAEDLFTLNFVYPAITEENSEDGFYEERPEMTITLLLDLTGLEDGTIRLKQASPYGSSDWIPCTYGGKTFEEARGKVFEN